MEKLLLLSSFEGGNLIKIKKSLLTGAWSVYRRFYCSFWGNSFLYSSLWTNSVFPGLQGGYKVNDSEQRQIQNGDRDAKLFSCF
jgi:hypothetical protein